MMRISGNILNFLIRRSFKITLSASLRSRYLARVIEKASIRGVLSSIMSFSANTFSGTHFCIFQEQYSATAITDGVIRKMKLSWFINVLMCRLSVLENIFKSYISVELMEYC